MALQITYNAGVYEINTLKNGNTKKSHIEAV
jgi:hypothetical protein